MTKTTPADDPAAPSDSSDAASAGLWPSPAYTSQIERLRAAVGETIYLVELVESAAQLGVRLTDSPFVLLGVIDFPRPDPARGLAPHLILLDDGRGVNLGRIARITLNRAFSPAPTDLLYLDAEAHRNLLFAERRLSHDFIAQRSRAVLGQFLGKTVPGSLAAPDPLSPERLAGPRDKDADQNAR